MDEWAGNTRRASGGSYTQYFYPESAVMVKLPKDSFIYGDICRWATDEINQDDLLKLLFGNNPYWTQVIFDTIDWRDMDTCMQKWQNNRDQW